MTQMLELSGKDYTTGIIILFGEVKKNMFISEKNLLGNLNSRMEIIEERVSELKDESIKIIQ